MHIRVRKQVDAIQQRLLENVDGVLAVHEFHVWQLAGDRIIASAHIRYVYEGGVGMLIECQVHCTACALDACNYVMIMRPIAWDAICIG